MISRPAFGLLVGLALIASPGVSSPRFVEQSLALGLDFEHRLFASGDKAMPENMGPGLAVLDIDGDQRLDVVVVQGAPVAYGERGGPLPAGSGHRIWRQLPSGQFRDITPTAGLGGGVGMGVCFGDIDRDGDPDLFFSHYGPDRLFENQGAGRFIDRSPSHGISDDALWSTGCTFFDPDQDGDLDLYVARYVDFTLANHKFCGNAAKKLRSYCHPDVYAAAADIFYRNDGTGRFTDATAAVGIRPSADGKGLGVLASDFDDDGRVDLFVANDSTANTLWLNAASGRFTESALLAGVALNAAGAAEAGMGIAWGDFDGDGHGELVLSHLDLETNTLYRPVARGLYADATDAAGLSAPSLPWVGFGIVAADLDLDTDLDLAVVNGHILDNIQLFDPRRQHRQPAQWLANTGSGRFREAEGGIAGESLVGRGLVAADLDRDGDLDLIATQNGGPLRVWQNRLADGRPALTVRLRGRESNPHGFGARLTLTGGQTPSTSTQDREMLAASGYLSQGPDEVVFAWPPAPRRLTVRWPSGQVDHVEIEQPGSYEVIEGSSPEQ